jgi:hypothetical protein
VPDTSLAKGLVETAKTLCPATGTRKPKQADLRRSVSAAYYAVFHHLARTCADVLVGTSKAKRPNKAWVEVYRGLDHGAAKNACQGAGNVAFPQGIKDFADAFKQLQAARYGADYDPMIRLTKVQALSFITLAKDSMVALDSAGKRDKIAFATWVLITSKGASDARTRVKAGNPRQV